MASFFVLNPPLVLRMGRFGLDGSDGRIHPIVTQAVHVCPRLKAVPCPLPRTFMFFRLCSDISFFPQKLQKAESSCMFLLHLEQIIVILADNLL